MKEIIDLYSKLVIGTFAFIGPSFTLLIPLFYAPLKKSLDIHKSKEQILQSIIADDIKNAKGDLEKKIKKGGKAMRKLVASNNKETNLLKPRRQVRRLFGSLLVAILFIALYYYQKTDTCPYKYQYLRIISLGISGLSFVYCLRVLWQVFSTIIRLKSEEEDRLIKPVTLIKSTQ